MFKLNFATLRAGIAAMLGVKLQADAAVASALFAQSRRPSYGSGPRLRLRGPVRPAGSKLARKAHEGKL